MNLIHYESLSVSWAIDNSPHLLFYKKRRSDVKTSSGIRFKHLKRHQKQIMYKYRVLSVIYFSHLYLYIKFSLCVFTFTNINIYIYRNIQKYTNTYNNTHTYIYMYVYIYIYIYIYIY